jgi:hypothetical protein
MFERQEAFFLVKEQMPIKDKRGARRESVTVLSPRYLLGSVAGTYNTRIVFVKVLAYYTRISYFLIVNCRVRDVLYANGNFNSSRIIRER